MKRFIVNADSTVTDTLTGLIWTQATVAKEVNHEAAEKAVAELGEGWRLPTVEELFALADRTRQEPAIDTDAFPDTESDWYWTSTPTAWSSAAVWVVGFDLGNSYGAHRDYDACVRAVRSVPSGQ
jgi:hypothetical protein